MAVRLTTEWQLIKQEYVGDAYGAIYLKCYAKYITQDVANNKTQISVSTNLSCAGTWYGTNGQTWKAGATGLPSASGQAPDSYSPGEVQLGTLTGWINHENDGTKSSMYVSSTFNSSVWGFSKEIVGEVSLPTIPRASKINSITNSISSDGNTVKVNVNFTKYASSFYQQLVLMTVGRTETIATFNGVISGTDYSLDATARQKLYNWIGTSLDNKGVICDLKTYSSSAMTTLVGTYSDLTYFKLPAYTISTTGTFTDTVNTYDTYKPTSDVLINNLSKPQFTLSATSSTGTYYGRSVSYKLGNTTISNPYTENNFTGQSLTFTATDGRKTATYTPTLNKVEYFKPTLTSSVTRTTPTGSTIDVSISGTYYDGTGLTNLETPTATIVYTEEGGTEQSQTIPLTTSTTDHTVSFNATYQLTGMNYQKDVTWAITISDVLGITNTNSGTLPQGLPVWNGYRKNNENYFNVNGKLLINNATFLNLVYPIGSIYMSVNNTDPSTLFGGTWVQLKDRFLLGAGDTYTNGTTGGSATHQHKLPFVRHNAGATTTNQWGLMIKGGSVSGEVTISSTGAGNENKIDSLNVSGTANTGAVYEYQFSSMNANGMPPYLTVYMWKRTA